MTSMQAGATQRLVDRLVADAHGPEVHLIAVAASERRTGVGRMLVERAALEVRSDGGKLLSVHTVGPSFLDAGYSETRRFYTSKGFIPLEEHDGLDWTGPTLILVLPLHGGTEG
jgi:GNAT superfamily N-acetyltransferase